MKPSEREAKPSAGMDSDGVPNVGDGIFSEVTCAEGEAVSDEDISSVDSVASGWRQGLELRERATSVGGNSYSESGASSVGRGPSMDSRWVESEVGAALGRSDVPRRQESLIATGDIEGDSSIFQTQMRRQGAGR